MPRFSNGAAAQPIEPPFPMRPAVATTKNYACPQLASPVSRLAPPSKYGLGGPARDTEDAEAEAAFNAAMAPVRDFSATVVKAANAFRRDGSPAAAACALAHLDHWAQAQALDQPATHTGHYKLATTLSGLALATLQIAPAFKDSDPRRRRVAAWLGERGQQTATYFETLKMPRASRNNHRAWAGLAMAATAAVAQDRRLFAQGLASFRVVACQATAQGALPLELERGRKATEYHLYALSALVMLAEFAEANGEPAYAMCDQALPRIIAFSLAALADPGPITRLAGAEQEPANRVVKPGRIAFLEPHLARFPDRATLAAPWLSRRPLGLTDLGGNLTLIYRTRS